MQVTGFLSRSVYECSYQGETEMKMPDGNSAALRDYEARVDAREKSYELHEPRAIEILKDRLLGDRPARKGELGPFSLAEEIINSSTHWLIDEEFVSNLILEFYHRGTNQMIRGPVETYTDAAIEALIDSERGQQEIEQIIEDLESDEQCDR